MRRGAFAPLTESGRLIVNDVLVSCYAKIADAEMAHAVFSPYRSISRHIPQNMQRVFLKWYIKALVVLNDVFSIVDIQ